MKTIRAAVVQFEHAPGDKAANLAKIEYFVDEAAAQGVKLIAFPEMCITGYSHVRELEQQDVMALAEPVPDGASTQSLLRLSRQYEMTIGAGLIELAPDGRMYNAYPVAMPDGRWACHRKLHCFVHPDVGSGNEYTVFDIPHGVRVGVLICYDNNIGENVRINALIGADVLMAPHQTGGARSPSMGLIDPELWRKREEAPEAIEAEFRGRKGRKWLMNWLPARAHDNGLFYLFSNGVGMDGGEVRTGGAMILDTNGDILVETWKAQDEMVVAALDAALREKSQGQRWIKARRPDLYGLLAEPTGEEESIRKIKERYGEVPS